MIVLRVFALITGAFVVVLTLGSAIRTVVLPRGVPVRLGRTVFILVRKFYRLRTGRRPSYERRDRIMALYGPTALFALLAVWVLLVMAGYEADRESVVWGKRGGVG